MFRNVYTIIIIAILLSVAGTTMAFQDVLDTPAVKSPLAAKRLLNDISQAGDRLVAVGQRGHIVYSNDLGQTWVQAQVPVSSDLVAVDFPSSSKGWAVGHDGAVLHTVDGGLTWKKQFDGLAAARTMADYYAVNQPQGISPEGDEIAVFQGDIQWFIDQGADKPFLDVWFEDESTGYIIGAFNLLFRTSDGGRSWTPWFDRIDNPRRYHLYAIRPIGNDLFICGEQGSVYRLDRKERRFVAPEPPYFGTFFGLVGKPGNVVAFGMRGSVYSSQDNGESWNKIETGILAGLTDADVADDGRIILVSQLGHVLVSHGDGQHFKQLNIERPFSANAVVALENGRAVLVGRGGVRILALGK